MDLITAIGTVADAAAVFYKELIKDGIPENVATVLTCKYIEITFGGMFKK